MKNVPARRFVIVGLALGLGLVGGQARAADPTQPAGRFSAAAIDLFQAVTCPQNVDDLAMPGHMDRDAVLKAAQSSDPRVADAAMKWLDGYYLRHVNDANIKEIQAAIEAAVPQFQVLMVKSLVNAAQHSDSGLQYSDVADMGSAISNIMREPQKAQIKQLQVEYEIAQLSEAMGDSLRAIADHTVVAPRATSGDLQVQFVTNLKTDRQHFGAVRVTNSLGRALHHCFLISQAKMNRAALDRLNTQGDGMALLSTLFGIAPDVAVDSARNGRLRNALFGFDRGVSNYAAALPAKNTLYFYLFPPNSTVDYVTSASLSLWSDELQATDKSIDNLAELRSSIRAARAATLPPRQVRPNAIRTLVTAQPDKRTSGMLSGVVTRLQDGLINVGKEPTTAAKDAAQKKLLVKLGDAFNDKPAKFHFPIVDVAPGLNGMFTFVVDRSLETDDLPIDTWGPNQLVVRMVKADALKATPGDVLVVSGVVFAPSGPIRNAKFATLQPVSISSLVSGVYTLSLRDLTYKIEAKKQGAAAQGSAAP